MNDNEIKSLIKKADIEKIEDRDDDLEMYRMNVTDSHNINFTIDIEAKDEDEARSKSFEGVKRYLNVIGIETEK